MSQTAIIVPCRLESTRFPRKLLHNIKGKPLLLWVAERISAQAPEYPLWFAVDDPLLEDCLKGGQFRALKTARSHQSGTDRIAEVASRAPADVYLNVQGDLPFIRPETIHRTVKPLRQDRKIPMATAKTAILDDGEWLNPNVVKVVTDARGRAAYFSRAPIPYARDAYARGIKGVPPGLPVYRHLGIYA